MGSSTEAWVLRRGSRGTAEPGQLEKATYPLPPLTDHSVLVEPIYGAWEANMTHCLERQPVDVCRIRREKEVVLGNAGVFRILKTGSAVTSCKEGDVCGVIPVGEEDEFGHMTRVLAYDTPNMMGVLAKRSVIHERNVSPPVVTKYSLIRWAGFAVRYATAWEIWKLSYNVWRAQFDLEECPAPYVSGWGGGVGLATAQLAAILGYPASLVASTDYRIDLLRTLKITPIDRREFPDLSFDEERFESDRQGYRPRYLRSEKAFLEAIERVTDGRGVSIFVDNIGAPVFRATLRALSRLGIVTTSGWKLGKTLSYDRVQATVARHAFLHVHGCRRSEGIKAIEFAEEHEWLPPAPPDNEVYCWDDVPQLAADFAAGKIQSYAPVFEVNPP